MIYFGSFIAQQIEVFRRCYTSSHTVLVGTRPSALQRIWFLVYAGAIKPRN